MITATTNPKIKLARALLAQRRTREEKRLFVVEGVRLVEEAACASRPAQLVLHTPGLETRGQAAVAQLAARGAPVELVSSAVFKSIADTQTPQGVLALMPMPEAAVWLTSTNIFALVLDGISDPGNLGTLLRTADAAGVQAVWLMPGTVDAYNPKVVRAAMGAHFHVPIMETDWGTLTPKLAGLKVWLAEARSGQAYVDIDWRASGVLVIGSEAEGPSEAARQAATGYVHIPMPGRSESLNAAVAAAVLLFEAARQRKSIDRAGGAG